MTESQAEREAAFRLVHQVYCRSGLSADDTVGMRVMRHHLGDQTDVMIAKRDQEILLTGTLVRDAEFGMPAESLFADEIAAMRAEGFKLAEVSCLASDDRLQDKKQRFELLVKLISLVIHSARRRGVDRLLLAVHPRHAKVYQRLFGCVICSEVKEYAAVQGNPAVLCMHDFKALDERRYPLYDAVYGAQYGPWQLDGTRMSDSEKEFFRQALCSRTPDMLPVGA